MQQTHNPDDDMFSATVGAFIGEDIGHYPIHKDRRDEKYKKIDPSVIISDITEELKNLNFTNANDAQTCLDQVRTGYLEVKSATEYQDDKTARLLTILAFLTAAAGAVYVKVLDIYPISRVVDSTWPNIIVAMVHILFVMYFFMIATGALISFHAMQTRFKTTKEQDAVTNKVRSLLFFKYISIAEPKAWAKEFVRPSTDLLTVYIKHYILETYLVAAKTSDKVRYLQPAQLMLQNAIRVLLVWIVFLVIATISVPTVQQCAARQAPAPQTGQT